MVSDCVDENDAVATYESKMAAMGSPAPCSVRYDATARMEIRARYTKNVGTEDTACRCSVSPCAA